MWVSAAIFFFFLPTFFLSISTHFLGRDKERESVRQCFLFSNHLILTSRTQGGKLHLVENVGKIPLADITLIEDPNEENVSEEPGNTKITGSNIQNYLFVYCNLGVTNR